MVYELPNGSRVAYRIRERTTTWNGVAEVIDLKTRTLNAKEGSREKQFALSDHCPVILRGDRSGHLKDLMPGQTYRFTYEAVNGINVLDGVTPAKAAETASVR